MSKWDKITLFKFQEIDIVNSRNIPDIDKTLFSICAVFGYTEHELDNLPLKKVEKMSVELTKIFSAPFEVESFNRIGKYFINYDIEKITFGQYIELAFFIHKDPKQPIKNAHYLLASVARTWSKSSHRQRAEYFLRQPVTRVVSSLAKLMQNFEGFNNQFASLFGIDKSQGGEEVQEDRFNKRYGWIFSATEVAAHERITLEQAMKLPVRQALNALDYLKSLRTYQAQQMKKQPNGR